MAGRTPALSAEAFAVLKHLLAELAGIELKREKLELIESRLGPRLRELRLASFEEYLVSARRDRRELSTLVDLLTTNKTSFYREAQHFAYTRDVLIPRWRARQGSVKLWSAACSSGEEPYSMAMLLHAELGTLQARILATDISRRVLERAQLAEYPREAAEAIPPEQRKRYLRSGTAPDKVVVAPEIKSMVSFARLNLQGPWAMRGPFDLILCRNAMIYFSPATRADLTARFARLLGEDGTLFIGHSETLNDIKHPLRAVQPAVYTV
jgi:chemotaxis protein methyltransferase CheR